MKTFKEYLVESKKLYSFKIKVAGELPKNFQEDLKTRLDRCKVATFEKKSTTPIQALPLDFPDHPNTEVTVFEVICEYPITAPEIANDVKATGLPESCFRVRGSGEPSEQEQVLAQAEPSDEAVLNDSQYKDSGKVNHKDYFGDDFNKSFLKDLSKAAKERKKEGTQVEYKISKQKQDKAGMSSPISKVDNPSPIKG
jgi:hypothetical protein